MIPRDENRNPFILLGYIVLFIVAMIFAAWADREWKKSIVKEAMQEIETAKGK